VCNRWRKRDWSRREGEWASERVLSQHSALHLWDPRMSWAVLRIGSRTYPPPRRILWTRSLRCVRQWWCSSDLRTLLWGLRGRREGEREWGWESGVGAFRSETDKWTEEQREEIHSIQSCNVQHGTWNADVSQMLCSICSAISLNSTWLSFTVPARVATNDRVKFATKTDLMRSAVQRST
jgi:hypothetical protein